LFVPQKIDLGEIERKTWMSYYQDGLWDIFFGLMLAASALSAWFSHTNVPSSVRIPSYLAVTVLAGLVMWMGKRFVTIPRLGRVKFGPARKAKMTKLRIVGFASVSITWALLVTGLGAKNGWLRPPEWWQARSEYIGSAIAILTFLIFFSFMAHFLEFRRLYLYGVLFALQEIAGVGLRDLAGIDSGFFIGAAFAAVISLVIGVIVFARFVRENPVLAAGE
jgi:MFS family permease